VTENLDSLILDLLAWIGDEPRPYAEVMEAWLTSCPRLPVWEEATDRGLVSRLRMPGVGSLVSVTAAGAEYRSRHSGRTVTLPWTRGRLAALGERRPTVPVPPAASPRLRAPEWRFARQTAGRDNLRCRRWGLLNMCPRLA
jgi:hypothetical protein